MVLPFEIESGLWSGFFFMENIYARYNQSIRVSNNKMMYPFCYSCFNVSIRLVLCVLNIKNDTANRVKEIVIRNVRKKTKNPISALY